MAKRVIMASSKQERAAPQSVLLFTNVMVARATVRYARLPDTPGRLSTAEKPKRSQISSATEIIAFWREAGPKHWFAHDPAFDRAITDRFGGDHIAASRGVLAGWEETADGALALLILTDQFVRNIWRNSAHAFATDAMARAIADRAIARSFDMAFDPAIRQFFYLPFQHHEDPDSQARAVALTQRLTADGGAAENLRYARLHQEIIARFGRFPHRNAVLGRVPTPEETEYLANGGFAG